MSYIVSSEIFEGPMELLLELIRKREMSIYDIQIHVLVGDFLEALDRAEEIELDVTADFIAMAAWLIKIKSQMLLPSQKVIEESEEEEVDPREELVERILAYNAMKEQSLKLKELADYEAQAIYKKQEDFSDFSPKEILEDVPVDELTLAFQHIMKRFEKRNRTVAVLREIPRQEFSLGRARAKIFSLGQEREIFYFSELAEIAESKIELITYFLTILELMKQKKMRGEQEKDFTDIKLQLNGDFDEREISHN